MIFTGHLGTDLTFLSIQSLNKSIMHVGVLQLNARKWSNVQHFAASVDVTLMRNVM